MSDGADSWQLTTGDVVVAECTFQEVLGGGRDFEAFAAFDGRLLCPVVVKVLRPDRASGTDALRRLHREIGIVGRLNHPSLVRGLHASLDLPRPYLCLERVFGPPLGAEVRNHGPVDIAVAVPLMLEVASVLHYMHSEGFVHLDVTPANVILGSPSRLIDLSLARSVADAARIEGPIGTRGYQAPEVLAVGGAHRVGPASDIWSLGATLRFGLTGNSLDDDGRMPAHMPSPLTELIGAMLADDPADRPKAEAVFDVADALADTLPSPRVNFFHPRGQD